MDHRQSKRVATNLRLSLMRRGSRMVTGRVKNASLHGMFVVTNPDDLRINQVLEIEYTLPDATNDERHHVYAVVVRKTRNGVALELEGLNEEEEHRIAALYDWIQRNLTSDGRQSEGGAGYTGGERGHRLH